AAEKAEKPAPRCVVRGVTRLRDTPAPDAGRALLHGSLSQIAHDINAYAECGVVDEVFLDLNFDSDEVGNPEADPQRAMDKALAVLELVSSR
ncbi:MAG TPA: hypothetical protein VKB75_00740, partial [Jatrophihabitans sp.]|nr:hypothetical protein [Jatrophihabitans sp.]